MTDLTLMTFSFVLLFSFVLRNLASLSCSAFPCKGVNKKRVTRYVINSLRSNHVFNAKKFVSHYSRFTTIKISEVIKQT